MIHKTNGSDRRVLNFPVVYPCVDISPSTLLASLISLSDSISTFKPTFFPCNKRNAANAIRLTRLLQPFLHEIRDQNPGFPDPAKLAFSELHVTFQKLLFLLEDSSREGARLRMLMESERVATEFRVVARSVATALDIFPFEAVAVSEEGEEQVLLLMKQAREARFEVEVDDKHAVVGVMSILTRFENRVAPDVSDVKRVLDYIGVCRWSECNKEVKFLEGEIGFEGLNEEKKRKVGMLSSLMGFMSYCRCVVMKVVDGEEGNSKKSDAGSIESVMILRSVNSDDFLCPISLELMKDPVTIETGHTYDRSSILKWLRSGNSTCPKTGKKLTSNELVPNLILRRLVQQYCSVNGIPFADSGRRNRDITRTVQPGSAAAEEAMKMVSGFLCGRIENGSGEEKNRAAFEMRLLSKTSIFSRSCLVEAGSVPLLLILLSSSDPCVQENAIAALLNLSKYHKSRAQMVENWGLELIVGVLNKAEKIEARQHAAAVLFYLASSNAEHGNKIGEEPEAIASLIRLIEDGPDRSQKNGLVAIFGLLKHPENVKRVITAGAIPLLVHILKSCEKEDIITDSLAILATVAERSDGTAAILHCGALDVAVEILSSSSTSRVGKEHCVSLLLCLSLNGGGDVVANLVKSPSLMGPLYSQLSEGTSRGGKKASALIRVLHDFYERRSSGFKAPIIPRDQFIHVW